MTTPTKDTQSERYLLTEEEGSNKHAAHRTSSHPFILYMNEVQAPLGTVHPPNQSRIKGTSLATYRLHDHHVVHSIGEASPDRR